MLEQEAPTSKDKVFRWREYVTDSSFYCDYIDNRENKEVFLLNNSDKFTKVERLLIEKVECKEDEDFEEVSYIEKDNMIIVESEDKRANVLFTKIDNDNICLSSILADRIIEESKDKQLDYNEYFKLVENAVYQMSKKYKNIYTYQEADFKYDKYFKRIKYIYDSTLYKYTLKK